MFDTKNKSSLLINALYLVILILYYYGFIEFVEPIFGYMGYSYLPDDNRILIGGVVTLFIVLAVPKSGGKFSQMFYAFAILFELFPMYILSAIGGESFNFFLGSAGCIFFLFLLNYVLPEMHVSRQQISENVLASIFIVFSFFVIFIVLLLGGTSNFNLDFEKVYDFRESVNDSIPGATQYITSWTGKIILPTAFILLIKHKKYKMACLSVIGSILLFGLTSHKAIIFYPLLAFFVYQAVKSKNVIIYLLAGFACVFSYALFDFYYGDNELSWIAALIFDRALYLPAKLNYDYFNFFSAQEFIYWSDSKLTFGLMTYKYVIDLPHVIGASLGFPDMGANTGMLGSGYAQAGYFGMIIYTIIIAFLLKFIDSISKVAKDQNIVIITLLVPMFTALTTADLPTTALSHGIIIGLLIISSLEKKNQAQASSIST